METLGRPSIGLFATVLHAFNVTDPRDMTVSDMLARVIDSLSEKEAQQLPASIGGVLPLLRSNPDRLRFAASFLVRFDMFEAAEALADLAIGTNDRELLLSAATLAGNPSVDPSLRERLSQEFPDDRRGHFRLYDSPAPANAEEMLIYEQRWPGARSADGYTDLAPVAVLDKTLPALKVIRLAASFVGAGAVVRQLSQTSSIPNWFGPQTVVICKPQTRKRILSKQPRFPEHQIIFDFQLENERDYAQLLQQADSALPDQSRLRLAKIGSRPSKLWDPNVYQLGVYRAKEVEFLTSATRDSLYRLARKNILKSRGDNFKYWSFRDLIAVRTWKYLQATQPRKRISKNIIPALAKFAGDPKAIKIGATASGNVLVDQGKGWTDIQTGNLVLDLPITDVDATFEPFELGGRRAPHLLRASKNTELHPAVLHGAPHLKGFRVTARSLAQLYERGGQEAILAAYPELENEELNDTIEIGRELIAA